MNILLFIVLFIAFFSSMLTLFRIPGTKSGKNLRVQIAVKEKTSDKLIHTFVKPLVKPVSKLIRLDPAREADMAQMLRRGGLELTPKEYYARAIVCAVLTLPLSLLMFVFGVPQLIPATLILTVVIYFHFMTDMKDKLKAKKDEIEAGLPGFVRSILYRIDQSGKEGLVQVNLISIFEDYLRVANDVFYYDVGVLITEMKSMDIQTALRNFDARVGLTEVSFLCGALIGLERGEQQSNTLSALANDMDLKAREHIKSKLAKRPGKVRFATIPLVIVAIITLLYVIIQHLFSSIGGLF